MTVPLRPHLFTPVQIGPITLKHRVVMAPLTRSRSEQPGDIPGGLMLEYYSQRRFRRRLHRLRGNLGLAYGARVAWSARSLFGPTGRRMEEDHRRRACEGRLHVLAAVAYGTLVARRDGGWPHAGFGFRRSILLGGCVARRFGAQRLDQALTASRPRYCGDSGIVEDYRKAAERAKAAGFDGVELHAANGYLPDQFLQDGSNKRTDAYGGSIENRSRFLLELVEALASVWGGDRVAVRIGPSGTWNGMSDSNPQALFAYVAAQLNRFGLAYLHIIEPRVKGNVVIGEGQAPVASEQLRKIFKGRIIAAGGFEPDSAEAIVENGDADLVTFGRYFVSNPDLPERIRRGLPLNDYDRDTFYTFDAHGYTDYPFYDLCAAA